MTFPKDVRFTHIPKQNKNINLRMQTVTLIHATPWLDLRIAHVRRIQGTLLRTVRCVTFPYTSRGACL